GTTDNSGRVKLPWPVGVSQLIVNATGAGYGQTGLIEIVEGKTAQSTLPPLAPYGVLEGKMEGWKPGVVVKVRTRSDLFNPLTPEVKDGVFRVELSAGPWDIFAREGDTKGPLLARGTVFSTPGEK